MKGIREIRERKLNNKEEETENMAVYLFLFAWCL